MMKLKMLFCALSLCSFAVAGCTQEAVPSPKIVVIYGDSITTGELLKDKQERWASQVESQAGGALQVINEGKGGRPTNSLGDFEAMMKRRSRMDALVIALGGNDARDVSGRCVPNALRNVKTMVVRARESYGAALPILLVAPTNIRKDALGPSKPIANEREANLIALNDAYPILAKEQNCAFVSTYDVVPHESLKVDGVHPDAFGHAEIAKVMLPAILKLVGKERTAVAETTVP